MKALTVLALFISVSVSAVPIESRPLDELQTISYSLKKPDPAKLLKDCRQPEGLIPAAKALLSRYFKTEMYNSTLFDKFLWLHPEQEEFIACVICNSGKPNDPYWERDFINMCNERDSAFLIATEPEDEGSTALL